MLLTNEVETTINSKTYRHYKELGYEFERVGDTITVKVEDLPNGSNIKIDVMCDYCNEPYSIIYNKYYKKMKRGKNSGNDILVYKDGAYIGKVTLFRDEFPYKEFAVNEHVFLVTAKKPEYQNYLFFTLHQDANFTLMQSVQIGMDGACLPLDKVRG